MQDIYIVNKVDKDWASGIESMPLHGWVEILRWFVYSPEPADGDNFTQRRENVLCG